MPQHMSREQLLATLDDIRGGVECGDTLEGSLQFTLNYDDPAAEHPYDTQAAYRVGNLMGQGGMRLIGHDAAGPRRIWIDGRDRVWIDDGIENGIEHVCEVTGTTMPDGDDSGCWNERRQVQGRDGLRQIGVAL
jgi:hypothetical protein